VKILDLGIIFFLSYSRIRDFRYDTYDTCETTTRVPTIGVATPTQDAVFCADEPRNATRHDADKPNTSVAMPTVTMPTRDSIYEYVNFGMPYDTLSNQR
jgi:hypothetical protein